MKYIVLHFLKLCFLINFNVKAFLFADGIDGKIKKSLHHRLQRCMGGEGRFTIETNTTKCTVVFFVCWKKNYMEVCSYVESGLICVHCNNILWRWRHVSWTQNLTINHQSSLINYKMFSTHHFLIFQGRDDQES